MAEDILKSDHLMGHVQDQPYFHGPRFLNPEHDGELYLPQPLQLDKPLFEAHTGIALVDSNVQPPRLTLTKFMVLEVAVGVIMFIIFTWLAMRMRGGGRPRGRLWNLLEAFLLFVRDEMVRPAIGKHDADRFLPFIWTLFFFVLGCNMMGLIPWMGSPTGALACTGALAFITFVVVVGSGMRKFGLRGYCKTLVPHMDLPLFLAIFIIPLVFFLEVLGLLIKHFVLAVRLLANMLAGHVVLAVILAFIAVTYNLTIWYGVAPASVLGATALSLLELFVAFLQAYIFAFLAALFIGMAIHPH